MKQIDNRQKQLIQSKAERAFKAARKFFGLKSKEKEKVHLPAEKTSQGKSETPEEVAPPAATYKPGPKVGRNDPCPCGSGKKYKKCCLNKG